MTIFNKIVFLIILACIVMNVADRDISEACGWGCALMYSIMAEDRGKP